jgi:hypothetical protein
MKITVRKIGSRWQPVDSGGQVVRGAVYNADGSGYSTRQGAVEAAQMLREIGGWGIRPAGTRYFVAHPDEVQEVTILFHGLGDYNVKRKYRRPVRVLALDGDEFFVEESELYTDPAAAAIRSAALAGKAGAHAARRSNKRVHAAKGENGNYYVTIGEGPEAHADEHRFDKLIEARAFAIDSSKSFPRRRAMVYRDGGGFDELLGHYEHGKRLA